MFFWRTEGNYHQIPILPVSLKLVYTVNIFIFADFIFCVLLMECHFMQCYQKWMDGWFGPLHPFQHYLVISGQWKSGHDRLYALKCCSGSERILRPVEPCDPKSEGLNINDP